MAGELDAIGAKAKEVIATAENSVLVSAVVIWEVAIKRKLGKLDAPPDLLEQIEQAGVDLLPITARHAERVGTLPMHHRDPFDRLLIAQAELEDLTLVTADTKLGGYGTGVIW